jgi:hypothetical protein
LSFILASNPVASLNQIITDLGTPFSIPSNLIPL